jgi:hypothetical protein
MPPYSTEVASPSKSLQTQLPSCPGTMKFG